MPYYFQPAIGLHLPELVQPVLTCFEDQDARVRYYACEALYNISKVARVAILVFFNSIFEGLIKASLRQHMYTCVCICVGAQLACLCGPHVHVATYGITFTMGCVVTSSWPVMQTQMFVTVLSFWTGS